MVNPQLPITTVVTPSCGDGEAQRVPGDLRVVVRMTVDDAWHQARPSASSCSGGAESWPIAAIRPSRTARLETKGAPQAVVDFRVLNDQVEHGILIAGVRITRSTVQRG